MACHSRVCRRPNCRPVLLRVDRAAVSTAQHHVAIRPRSRPGPDLRQRAGDHLVKLESAAAVTPREVSSLRRAVNLTCVGPTALTCRPCDDGQRHFHVVRTERTVVIGEARLRRESQLITGDRQGSDNSRPRRCQSRICPVEVVRDGRFVRHSSRNVPSQPLRDELLPVLYSIFAAVEVEHPTAVLIPVRFLPQPFEVALQDRLHLIGVGMPTPLKPLGFNAGVTAQHQFQSAADTGHQRPGAGLARRIGAGGQLIPQQVAQLGPLRPEAGDRFPGIQHRPGDVGVDVLRTDDLRPGDRLCRGHERETLRRSADHCLCGEGPQIDDAFRGRRRPPMGAGVSHNDPFVRGQCVAVADRTEAIAEPGAEPLASIAHSTAILRSRSAPRSSVNVGVPEAGRTAASSVSPAARSRDADMAINPI
jgi:hypothetical protein